MDSLPSRLPLMAVPSTPAPLALVAVLLCALAAAPSSASAQSAPVGTPQGAAPRSDVPWRCRVCEDAVQTWHDQFPCAGGFLDWGDPRSLSLPGCQGPAFKCNSLGGVLRDACLSMQEELSVTDGLKAKTLWESMMLHDDPYRACIDIEKCPTEPSIEDKDTWSGCLRTFRDNSTLNRPYSKEYEKECEEPCYLCLFLVKFWPLFGETCRPEGAQLPQSVPLPNDVGPGAASALVETAARSRGFYDSQQQQQQRSGQVGGLLPTPAVPGVTGDAERFADVAQGASAVSRARARAAAYERMAAAAAARSGAAPSGEEQMTELQTGLTLPKECFARWKEIERTPRARYFVSWKKYVNVLPNNLDRLEGRMWDANVVCKCLGHCDVSRFEDLGMMDACRYGDVEEQMMDALFSAEGKIPQHREV